MRFTVFTLALLVATFLSICSNIASAEGIELANKDAPAHDTKLIALTNIVHRLRGRHKLHDEERVAPNYAAMSVLLNLKPTTQSQVLHAVENHEPLPKWARALAVLLTLGVAGGVIFGGVKTIQMVNKTDE
ncbi:hypothetical protein PHYPSEUDO_003933 [Phytophthora pseudosyringae]|uniref:RxLR effector protein n=1 Tax=Phytophthora pseudosyringae TaxID=221518 RepID=A0A8T1VSU2_9STRA|nr:hypothetical protein PHYPSEUDO_003933 [Phytophthora pseudosyringae]